MAIYIDKKNFVLQEMPIKKNEKPLQLADTLHDLAILRASDISLSRRLPRAIAQAQTNGEMDEYVTKSYEFAREARAAIRIADGDKVDAEGSKIDAIRSELEGVMERISGAESTLLMNSPSSSKPTV